MGQASRRFFHIDAQGELRALASAEEALAAAQPDGYCWLDFDNPTREELLPLQAACGLHPLSIEDCLDEEQVPKLEEFPTNAFLLLNRYRYVEQVLVTEELNFFLGRNFVISITHLDQGLPQLHDRLRERLELSREALRRGPDFLLHLLLDYHVDQKHRAVEQLQDELDGAEEAILDAPRAYAPETLMRLRRSLLTLRKSLFNEREILVRICRRDTPFISEKAVHHFRDIYDHLAKYFELTEIHRELITSLMELYLSLLNNEMNRISNRTNSIVRRLTLITTIFMPLTLLAGIGGMSEWSMIFQVPQHPERWPLAYGLFLLATVGLGGLTYLLLRGIERRDARRED